MGLVLWIDVNTFATGLIEKVFKKKNLEFYALSSAKDFAYLIEDLKPALLVIDAKTALDSLERFRAQYEQTSGFAGIPVVILDHQPGLEFIQNRSMHLKRPLDPFEVAEVLNKFLAESYN